MQLTSRNRRARTGFFFAFLTAVTDGTTSGTGQIGTGGTSNGGVVSVSGAIVTVPLTNVANAQKIALTLSNVSDQVNTNDVIVPIGVLLGDTTGNGNVNASDVSQTKAKSGQPVDATNFRNDVTVNGSINASDVSLVKSKVERHCRNRHRFCFRKRAIVPVRRPIATKFRSDLSTGVVKSGDTTAVRARSGTFLL